MLVNLGIILLSNSHNFTNYLSSQILPLIILKIMLDLIQSLTYNHNSYAAYYKVCLLWSSSKGHLTQYGLLKHTRND